MRRRRNDQLRKPLSAVKRNPREELYMEKHEHVFERFIDFENLYGGYLLARRNKRYTDGVLLKPLSFLSVPVLSL